jgi:CBS domain-containing protein
MPDSIEEELQIMDERSKSANSMISAGVDIEDPIRTLDLVPVVAANQNSSIKEVIELLLTKNIGCALIVDDLDQTVGIFTERDILKKIILKDIDLSKTKIKEYMTKNPEVLSENDPIAFALNRMSDGSFRHIPITKNGKVQFMLSVKDIVDHIAFTYRKAVLNLPPNLRQASSEYGG